jgi:hypothetical protein
MRAVRYWSRATRRRATRSTLVVIFLCAVLEAVAVRAIAGARRIESAYSRYLRSDNASDVMVNIPSPDTALALRHPSVARTPAGGSHDQLRLETNGAVLVLGA